MKRHKLRKKGEKKKHNFQEKLLYLPCFEPCLNSFWRILFSLGSLSPCCCHGVPCWSQLDTQFSVEEIRVFQACLLVTPSQVVCFENHAEWRFCLVSFWCVAPCRHSGARLAQWRPSALLLPSFCSRLVSCTCALLWMFILTHATALIAVSFKNSHIHCTIFNRVMSPIFVCVDVGC